MKVKMALWLLSLFMGLPLSAQQGLHIEPLFNGQYRNQKGATEVLMKGRKLQPYKLTLFRSLTLPTGVANVRNIERMVHADASAAIDKEVGIGKNRLYYGFYQLKPRNGKRRYLFYRNNSLNPGKSKQPTLTIIYMEGSATIEELKRNFGK